MVNALLGVSAVYAQSEPDVPIRFEMQETDKGLIRLDTQTGIVSLCEKKGAHLICQPSVDGIKTYEDEITRLEVDNSHLRQELTRISEVLAVLTVNANNAAKETSNGLKLSATSSNEEGWLGKEEEKKLNDALEFTENAMRRFFSVVEEMKDDFQNEDTDKPAN
ncbi:hypothetical protein SAMN04515695_1614 [Pseudovibrio sp. Tun.PSC04-5.I4]|nr:hypothetical protein SAMN04515695_1614 [Pseudovibrio sp. Tun.PSC04-5.I4]